MERLTAVYCGNACGTQIAWTDNDHELCASKIGLYCDDCAPEIERETEEMLNEEERG